MDIRTTPDKKSALWISVLSIVFAFGIAALIGLFLLQVFEIGTLLWVSLIIGEALIIVPALIYVRSRHYDLQKSFRLAPPPSGTLPLAALIGISLQPIADELDKLFSQLFSTPEQFQEILQKTLEALKIEILVGEKSIWSIGSNFFGNRIVTFGRIRGHGSRSNYHLRSQCLQKPYFFY